MFVRAAEHGFTELEIEATAVELYNLAELVRAGQGEVLTTESRNPTPYDVALGGVVVACDGAGPVRLRVDWSGDRMVIEGGGDAAELLAINLADFDGVTPGAHFHFEHNPVDSYFAEESTPLVIQLLEPASERASLAARSSRCGGGPRQMRAIRVRRGRRAVWWSFWTHAWAGRRGRAISWWL